MEGLVGHIASWAVHTFVLGVVLLFVLAYALGWIKSNKQIPVEAVTFSNAGGGGDPSGSGQDHGDKAPLAEGVHADKNNPGNTTNPSAQSDRPDLHDVVPKPDDPTFTPPHYVNADPRLSNRSPIWTRPSAARTSTPARASAVQERGPAMGREPAPEPAPVRGLGRARRPPRRR